MRTRSLLLAIAVATTGAALTACDDPKAAHDSAANVALDTGVVPSLGSSSTQAAAPAPASTPSGAATPSAAPSAPATSASPAAKTTAAAKSTTKAAAAPAKAASGGGAAAAVPAAAISGGYNANADSAAEIAAAMSKAKADGKNVLLDFGANWCGNCKALDKLLTGNADVQNALNSSYHFVKVDIGDHSTTNMKILQGYDSSGSYAMPVLIVVTPSGTVTASTQKVERPKTTADGFTAFLRKWAA
ncbi:thioredoxin family protein [Kitasatospora sp. MBT63]|uniref:thioredoxin family protein n=1 Tax=Kitasatospora sp. MBT63 TaxID=1444768 RepID=UPI00068CF0F2|nr:thioredoxin family protein [Kitasatospora sp. MBT63]